MAKTNTADIGFEKEIWKAADLLRGNLDASEYKSVVLGLIFLKYISDRFEAKYNALVAEGDGFEEDKDEYTSENIFFVPQEALTLRMRVETETKRAVWPRLMASCAIPQAKWVLPVPQGPRKTRLTPLAMLFSKSAT